MDIIFPFQNFIEDIVSENLVVFNHTTHLKFLDSECDVKFFGLVVPCETFDLQSEDSFGQFVKISGFWVVDFDLENDNGFGDWFWFFSFGSGRSSWFCSWFSRSIIISKRIEIIILFFLFFFLFFLLLLLIFFILLVLLILGFILSPDLNKGRTEVADEEIPVVKIGVDCSVGKFWIGIDVLPRAR